MKRLKSTWVILFSLLLCLCLAACSNGKNAENTGDDNCKHLWVKETHDKNRCTEKTLITRTCEKCGKREVLDEIAPLGHSFPSEYAAVKDACTICGIKVNSNCKHEEIKVYRIREVTCTINGEDHHVCSKCFFNTKSEMIKALGHDETVYPEVEPTCTEEGRYYSVYCNRCGYSTIDAHKRAPLGHDYVNGVCSRCGEKE